MKQQLNVIWKVYIEIWLYMEKYICKLTHVIKQSLKHIIYSKTLE
jgi:hypothetical protein